MRYIFSDDADDVDHAANGWFDDTVYVVLAIRSIKTPCHNKIQIDIEAQSGQYPILDGSKKEKEDK